MKTILTHWKTSSAGIGMIAAGVVAITQHQIEAGIAQIIAGIGLLSAKDGDKTGVA